MACLATTALPVQSQEVVEILVPEYPPYAGTQGGPALWQEIIAAAYARKGIEVRWASYPLERMKAMVKAGTRVAFVNSPLSIAPDESAWVVALAQPFTFVDVVAFYDRTRFPAGLGVRSAADLAGKSASVLRGTGSVKVLTQAGVAPEISDSIEAMFRKLGAERIDVAVIGDLTGLDAIGKFIPAKSAGLAYESVYLSPITIFFSARDARSAGLRANFEAGLDAIKKDGTLLRIASRYYPAGKLNRNILPPDLGR